MAGLDNALLEDNYGQDVLKSAVENIKVSCDIERLWLLLAIL